VAAAGLCPFERLIRLIMVNTHKAEGSGTNRRAWAISSSQSMIVFMAKCMSNNLIPQD
jgi:hypothetical protein